MSTKKRMRLCPFTIRSLNDTENLHYTFLCMLHALLLLMTQLHSHIHTQLDDDTAYDSNLVASLVTHMPPGKAAVAASCEEPRVDMMTNKVRPLTEVSQSCLSRLDGMGYLVQTSDPMS